MITNAVRDTRCRIESWFAGGTPQVRLALALETMNVIEHSVFAEPAAGYPIASLLFPAMFTARRERNRERIRQAVAEFINKIGVESVLSVAEHASTLGPFSITVWWHRDSPDVPRAEDTEALVIRPSEASKTAYDYQWQPNQSGEREPRLAELLRRKRFRLDE